MVLRVVQAYPKGPLTVTSDTKQPEVAVKNERVAPEPITGGSYQSYLEKRRAQLALTRNQFVGVFRDQEGKLTCRFRKVPVNHS